MTKDPNAILDYSVDWAPWLAAVADTINTSTWTVPSGITSVTTTNTTTKATIWLSGGSMGATYQVTNRIVTTGGRTDDRSIFITIEDK